MQNLVLKSDGYFHRESKRWVPVGVNYWPGSCGVELWNVWPEQEIQRDLDIVKGLGLNTVRFFLRWQDFEPTPGVYEPAMWHRLRTMLQWCRERELLAHPSLFVGWMSGGVFWPQWKQERNLYSDPSMRLRAREFVAAACAQMAGFEADLFAVDLGNEMDCLEDCNTSPPAEVVAWCREICEAIRIALPDILIVSGNDQCQITRDTGWRFGEQPGTDFYSVHTYPVPAWHSVALDGMTDPLAAALLPLYTKCARAFGPVMVQEFGTIISFGQTQQDQYLRRLLPALWDAGANGFLWWCLRDITSTGHPYEKACWESNLGLVDAGGKVKAGLEYFIEFAKQTADLAAPVTTSSFALLWPANYYPKKNPLNAGNDPGAVSRRMLLANYMLGLIGETPAVIREDADWHGDLKVIVVAGVGIGLAGARRLRDFANRGGKVVIHGIDPVNLGPDMIALLGAEPVDLRTATKLPVEFGGSTWVFSSFPRNMRVELRPTTATIAARDHLGIPALLVNRVGSGAVVYCIANVEDSIGGAEQMSQRDAWKKWYQQVIGLLQN
jgi:hypothetical protein